MPQSRFKYIFGPVSSWRLGTSLGIDPISTDEKVCNFNCCYCQLGSTLPKRNERQIFVPTADILEEVKDAPTEGIDYYTFSGNGEPTLAANLGELIRGIKRLKSVKVAVITNSSLIDRLDVRNDLLAADFVLVKIDAADTDSFLTVNDPESNIKFEAVIDGIQKFRREFKGKLGLQIMFVEKNIFLAGKIADIAKKIEPEEVQINTPLRISAEKPLDEETLTSVKKFFEPLKVLSVYDTQKREVKPMDEAKTFKRHGSYENK